MRMEQEATVVADSHMKLELVDFLLDVVRGIMFWILIVVSNVRLILLWILENIVTLGPRVWLVLTTGIMPYIRTFSAQFMVVLLAVFHAPCLGASISKLYHVVRLTYVSCLFCGQLLHRDDLCDKIFRKGRQSIMWVRQYLLNKNGCHQIYRKIAQHTHRICFFIIQRSYSQCPRLFSAAASCLTAVQEWIITRYLGHILISVVWVPVVCLQLGCLLIVRASIALLGFLVRWLYCAAIQFYHFVSLDTRNYTICNMRRIGSRILSAIGDLRTRYQCPVSMTHWRTPHIRCSPRSAFYAILGFVAVTFVVTTYLYLDGAVGVSDPTQHEKHWLLKQEEELRLVDHGDQLVDQNIRHKNPHKKKESIKGEIWSQLSTPKMRQVLDVISLMAGHRSPNETTTQGYQKQTLRRQIKLLREEMISKKTMLPKLTEPPSCVGNVRPGEVEDVFCIPRPKYESSIKNPCWYSDIPADQGKKTVHCLPYFHILGCAKSGTTDLWNRLMSHPHTVSNDGLLHKEALWWSWFRYGISGYSRKREVQNFSNYVDLFQDTARQIQTSIDKENHLHQTLITGDASPPDFWDFRGWVNISQNRGLDIPVVITPHLMRHMYAKPKFIIMFRDPIDRLYSDYFFVGLGLTAQDFHNDILASIDMLAKCVEQHGLQRCFHDHELYVKLPVRLPFACYSVFVREWLRVFPLESFLFVKTEEYEKNPEDTLKSVMAFLGLGPLKESQLQMIAEEERARVTVQRRLAGPMKNITKHLLEELLSPCSTELNRLIRSDKFTWAA